MCGISKIIVMNAYAYFSCFVTVAKHTRNADIKFLDRVIGKRVKNSLIDSVVLSAYFTSRPQYGLRLKVVSYIVPSIVL